MKKLFFILCFASLAYGFDFDQLLRHSPDLLRTYQNRLNNLLAMGMKAGFDQSNNAFYIYQQILVELNKRMFDTRFDDVCAQAIDVLKAVRDENPDEFDLMLHKYVDHFQSFGFEAAHWVWFQSWLWPKLMLALKTHFDSPMIYFGPEQGHSIEEFFEYNGKALDPSNKDDWRIARLSMLVGMLPYQVRYMLEHS